MFMAHSEENAIANAARHGVRLEGSTFYITGMPCTACFRKIINVGAKNIIYGPINSKCIDEKSLEAVNIMMVNNSVKMRQFTGDYQSTIDLLKMTTDYCETRKGLEI